MTNENHENPSAEPTPRYETDEHAHKRFQGWRLIGVILIVVAVLAGVSFVVDWMVIGPLEGRVF
jgi:hypothetical protein